MSTFKEVFKQPFQRQFKDYTGYEPETSAFVNRVETDGGTVEDQDFLDQFISHAKNNGYYGDIVAAYSPSWGVKGTATASKLYSVIGASSDLAQAVGGKQPTISVGSENGNTVLTFDGTDDFLSDAFGFNLPETIILMGFRQITWTANDFICDGAAGIVGAIKQVTGTPKLTQQVGAGLGADNSDLAVNTAGHVRALFNQPSDSKLQIDRNAEVASSLATVANMSGFSLGGKFNDSTWANISVGAIVLLNSAVDGDYGRKMEAIYEFGRSVYNTP